MIVLKILIIISLLSWCNERIFKFMFVYGFKRDKCIATIAIRSAISVHSRYLFKYTHSSNAKVDRLVAQLNLNVCSKSDEFKLLRIERGEVWKLLNDKQINVEWMNYSELWVVIGLSKCRVSSSLSVPIQVPQQNKHIIDRTSNEKYKLV